jgi:hypothetical protein
MATKIQVRRDTSANWTTANPTLFSGEIGFETDTGKFKIGNGSTVWSSLDYFLDSSDLSGYLTAASASTTYLTQASASTTYLTQASASTTYLTQASASTTYATKTGATFSGNIIAPEVRATTKLVAQTVGGDEGGEILLGKAATNTTLTGDGVTIDVFQNRLRIFEQGGDERGGYIDVSTLGNGVATNLVPGMTLVKKQTIGTAVASVTVSDAFSATYENYKIIVSGGTASTTCELDLSLGGITTQYRNSWILALYSSTGVGSANNSATTSLWKNVGNGSTNVLSMNLDIMDPFTPKYTRFMSMNPSILASGVTSFNSGTNINTTSATAFTITPSTGTLTGGTIYVYGYRI